MTGGTAPRGRLRAGWKALTFFISGVVAVFAALFVLGVVAPRLLQTQPLAPAAGAALVLALLTWMFLRVDGERFWYLGLAFNRWRLGELGYGLVIGVVLVGLLFWILRTWAGLTVSRQSGFPAVVLATSFVYFALSVLFEELLFRGYGFQRLWDVVGAPAAIIISALLFGGYHIFNRGMAGLGVDELVWTLVGSGVGGVLFGVAYVRSNGMALPIGVHLGWNYAQWLFLTPAGSGARSPWTAVFPGGVMPQSVARPALVIVGAIGCVLVSLHLRGTLRMGTVERKAGASS